MQKSGLHSHSGAGIAMSILNDYKPSSRGNRINVEICQYQNSILSNRDLIHAVKQFLTQHVYHRPSSLNSSLQNNAFLSQHVQHISLWDAKENCLSLSSQLELSAEELSFFVFRLHTAQHEDEMLEGENDDLPAASHLILPSHAFHNVWETLIYDTDIKENLLSYASTGLLFADKGVNQNIITWNRVVLLHGPPGTGKTSLCHALAHKLAIRLSHRFSTASILEVNSHSLFSKWFSESGKLVMKMFKKVEELVENEDHLVCLLIDEVESLTAARSSVASGTEPSDAIRVVNALLTQIDRLKKYRNVVILTTSNVTGKIDLAFVDRADIKFYIGLPSAVAIYSIYRSCLEELARARVIQPKEPLDRDTTGFDTPAGERSGYSQLLWKIANKSVGLSGRTLRKLPFLAHARFIRNPDAVALGHFLDALSKTVEIQFAERENLSNMQCCEKSQP